MLWHLISHSAFPFSGMRVADICLFWMDIIALF